MIASVRNVVVSVSATALLALAIAAPPSSAVAAGSNTASGTAVVDPSVSYQTIQGWGTSLAWWAEAAGGWSTTNRQALDRAIFGLTPGGNGLGLNVVRYNIGATTPGDTCAAGMRVGAATPSFDTIPDTGTTGGGTPNAPGTDPTKNYNWANDPNQVAVLTDAQADGANVFAAAAYSAPASLTKDNCSAGSADGSQNIASTDDQAFADYVSTIVKHFHDTVGIPFSTVDPLNEPTQSYWNNKNCSTTLTYPNTKCQQGMTVGTADQGAITTDLAGDLTDAAYVHLAAPDEQKMGGTIADLHAFSAAQQAAVTQLDTHDYGDWGGSTDSGVPINLLSQQTNTPVWMSEWGGNADVNKNVENHPSTAAASAAMGLSEQILKNENEMHPTAWAIWQAADGPFVNETTQQGLVDGGGDANDLWGLVNIDASSSSNQTVSFPLRYYAMGNYSEFVRPGYRMIRNTDPNAFTAFDQGSNTLVIVATNTSSTSAAKSYDLSRFGLSGGTVAAYQTAADTVNGSGGPNEEHLAKITSPTLNTATGTLSDTVPPDSITTYVVSGAAYAGSGASTEIDDAVVGSSNDQWNYTGSGWLGCSGAGCNTPQTLYDGTTHWDATAKDTASTTFSGSQARLFGVTDANEGRATVSVDGSAPTELDFYSPNRHGDQLMWESPQLSPGTHTLTVTVLGSKNPHSSGSLIAIDRAEVDPVTTVSVDDATKGTGSDQWNYSGTGWVHCAQSSCADPTDMYAGTASWDGTAGDAATLAFTGTSILLDAIKDTNEGIANLSVDGAPPTPVDFYSPTRTLNVPVFAASGLANTTHTLTLTVTDQKDAQATGTVPVIDRAIIGSLAPAAVPSLTSIDDAATGTGLWSYGGSGWQSCSGTACGDPQNLYGGTTHWDSIANDTATLPFTTTSTSGTSIGLYAVTDTGEGRATVAVDGGAPSTVDFYSSTRHGNQLLWHADSLSPGSHTLSITVLGTKDSASSGTMVALDRAAVGVTPFIRSDTPGTLRNNFSGSVGMQFTTGPSGLLVTAVGRMHVAGNSGTHALDIYTTNGTLVGGASVNTAVANVDTQGFQYAALPQPITLTANTTYYLVSAESNGGDQWYDANSTATLASGGTINPVYMSTDSSGTSTWTAYPTNKGQAYGLVSLLAG